MLRPGNAAANSGADQLGVVAMAIAQLPVEHQQGHQPGDDADSVGIGGPPGRRSGAVARDDWGQARDMVTESGPHQARGRGLATWRDAAVVRAPKSGGGRGHKGRRRCRKTSND